MHVKIKGTTPGVEWGKELSLSVEERSSPKSHSPWADADGLRPVTYIAGAIHTDPEVLPKSILKRHNAKYPYNTTADTINDIH